MRKAITLVAVFVFGAFPLTAANEEKEDKRLERCGKILDEIMNVPETAPQYVLDRADCVIVVPAVLKGSGFIFTAGIGGSYGRGAMTCRTGEHFDGPWGAPTMVALEGGSWGLQIGFQAVDVLMFLMNSSAANSILTSKVKIGGDASASAGPVGRDVGADADVTLRAEILTFSRAKGLFAGASLAGSTVRADSRANTKLYHKKVDAKNVVLHSGEKLPDGAKPLLDELEKRSPRNLSDISRR